tara:strand:- start:293 stop:1285 length:993 start_codon:yes stop_codon:yes gene_type:complete
MSSNFKAFVAREDGDGLFSNAIENRSIDDLPKGDLTIKVAYSSINYKDALSASGNKGVTKNYPHTPGIDAAGIVVESTGSEFSSGDKVIVTGYDLGMNTSGGFSEYIRVPSKWAIQLPQSLSLKESMALGTGGLTAGLCINLLNNKNGITNKKAIVTGATGGVGCIAVQLLSKLGAEVTAVTGKKNSTSFLNSLGANTVITRAELDQQFRKPLSKGLYDIGIDVVGGNTLSGLLTCLNREGTIACCGNVGGVTFETTVFPFILRGNSLLGVDSAERNIEEKEWLWNQLSSEWKIDDIDQFSRTASLNDLDSEIKKILEGGQTGRVIVKTE